ncbi:MAG: Uma2 family endonuclease [Bryobacteraceae bacterium]
MSIDTLVPVSEYLSTTYRPDREYLDGVILERNLGEWYHSRAQMLLARYLSNREAEWGILVVPEQRVQVKASRFRVPDICVILGPDPQEQILTAPPFLCIEILSKDDTMSSMQERIADYIGFGVPYVWVLDPRSRRAYSVTAAGMQEAKEVLSTKNPDIRVPLSEIFV